MTLLNIENTIGFHQFLYSQRKICLQNLSLSDKDSWLLKSTYNRLTTSELITLFSQIETKGIAFIWWQSLITKNVDSKQIEQFIY